MPCEVGLSKTSNCLGSFDAPLFERTGYATNTDITDKSKEAAELSLRDPSVVVATLVHELVLKCLNDIINAFKSIK